MRSRVSDPTLYLFDGYNLLHAGDFADPRELTDALASFVALRGARGIVVFDGVGEDRTVGSLEIRYAMSADALLERLAAEHRADEHVRLVTSDAAVRGTSGQEVTKVASRTFLAELSSPRYADESRSTLQDRVDEETRAELERRRRGGT